MLKLLCISIIHIPNFSLDFQNFNFSTGRTIKRVEPACQILWKSLQLWPRYRDFSIFQDSGRHHLGFSKFRIFNGRASRESNCVTVPNFVEIVRTAAEICEFQYYASLSWKFLFTPLFGVFGGTFHFKWCHLSPNPKKDHPWAKPRHLSHKSRIFSYWFLNGPT